MTMIISKIILIIVKVLYLIASIAMTMYCIDFAIQEKQSYKYDNNGWLILSIIWVITLIFAFIMVFSSVPYWNWIKILTSFFPLAAILMFSVDPNDIFYENYHKNKFLFSVLSGIVFTLPWILTFLFELNYREYFKEQILENKFKTTQITMYKDCTDSNDPKHFHVMYYDEDNYIKSMKVYPGDLYKDLSEIDPNTLVKSNSTPIIITSDRNEIEYLYQDKKGKIRGPIILYCTHHFYDEFIKKVKN